MTNQLTKKCGTCNTDKPLNGFFLAPQDGAGKWHGSSTHCIECHDKGLIKHGYGDPAFGELYKRPDWYRPCHQVT